MKKIITLILALAFGVCAFAKTSAELTSEFSAQTSWDAKVAYVAANSDDVAKAWQEFKASPLSQLEESDAYKNAFAKLSKSEQNAVLEKTAMFNIYAGQNPTTFDGNVGQKIKFLRLVFERHNAGDFASVKSDGWKVDGAKLSDFYILLISIAPNDADGVYAGRAGFAKAGKGFLESDYIFNQVRRMVLYMQDVAKAKEICNAYENAMLEKDCANIAKIQAISKALTARIVDSKITK